MLKHFFKKFLKSDLPLQSERKVLFNKRDHFCFLQKTPTVLRAYCSIKWWEKTRLVGVVPAMVALDAWASLGC